MQEDLTPGTHLTTRRLGYVHHGLYAGSGRVIHYAGFERWFRRGAVEAVTLTQFARGRGWQVKTPDSPRFEGQAAVDRASARLGENRYSLWRNNCEHFVEWCLSGTPRSTQVEALARLLRTGLVAMRPWMRRRRARGGMTA